MVILVMISLLWHHPTLVSIQRLLALPLLFAGCSALIFCISTDSAFGLLSCDADSVGRFATPLELVLPFLFAATITLLSRYLYKKGDRQPHQGAVSLIETRSNLGETLPLRSRLSSIGQGLLFVLLLIYLCAHVWSYWLTDVGLTFQSPFCEQAPATDEAIISYMQYEHIHYAWGLNWLAYPIVFKTNDSIIMSDPRPVTSGVNLGRIPAYTIAIVHADRPSILIFARHTDPYPGLLRVLDSKHVTYRAARFPAEVGFDVLVVTPLSRTVSIFELTHSATHAFIFPMCTG